jgi:large subunit ribosomal protein L34e
MPRPKNRSRSVRRLYRRTPKGNVVIHYKRREKGGRSYCALCHSILGGASARRGLPKTKKRPERIFGGRLCQGCVRRVVSCAARIRDGKMKMEDVEIRARGYVGSMVK